MFSKTGTGWLDRIAGHLFGVSETENYFNRQAAEVGRNWLDRGFGSGPPEATPIGEPDDDYPTDGGADNEEYHDGIRPNLELVDFAGASEDVAWMTYDHDTRELIVQYLEHGDIASPHAHIYAYQDFPYEEFEALREGRGPFPKDRSPYYTKIRSVGQRVNFYVRNDQRDDQYEYQRVAPVTP